MFRLSKSRRASLHVFSAHSLVLLSLFAAQAQAEDGYELWLRYHPLPAQIASSYRPYLDTLVANDKNPTAKAATAELRRGLKGLLGTKLRELPAPAGSGSIVLGTPDSSAPIARLNIDLSSLGPEGYTIVSSTYEGHRITAIAANTDVGVLYGTFRLLRLIQTGVSLARLNILEAPLIHRRVLDHWDNLDGSVERGYAGASIWDWFKLPLYTDPRYIAYARACASIGINGTVPNNVNSSALSLSAPYLLKAAALANVLRPYGIRLYLTARFSAPIEIGGLKTADPLDPEVAAWWRNKADEIYALIPDFGGFLVKANSEGEPGPQDYGRTHADGANLLATALAPHGGIVMWRAFVYDPDATADRVTQAYTSFVPLDGQFRSNVILQVKNGPLDFQPREPFNPLFGAMPRTPLMLEFQLTKEYLGFSTHLAYLGPLFEEVLQSDTYARGEGSTVARVVSGSLFNGLDSGIAGVANIGSDRNWTGSHFDQANWYAFGRLSWNPTLHSRDIAEEWVRMTFSNKRNVVLPIVNMMMKSREAVVDYMTPLGLAHQMALSHYGPEPWRTSEPVVSWTAHYFNRADRTGIGIDRTSSGSNAVAQYAPELTARFGDLNCVPDSLLLWFHHVAWTFRMPSGRSLWQELIAHYDAGVQYVSDMRHTWSTLAGGDIDPDRYEQIAAFLQIQEREARWWRDASIAYFQDRSGLALPDGIAPPQHDLSYYKTICVPIVPGTGYDSEPLCKDLTHPSPF